MLIRLTPIFYFRVVLIDAKATHRMAHKNGKRKKKIESATAAATIIITTSIATTFKLFEHFHIPLSSLLLIVIALLRFCSLFFRSTSASSTSSYWFRFSALFFLATIIRASFLCLFPSNIAGKHATLAFFFGSFPSSSIECWAIKIVEYSNRQYNVKKSSNQKSNELNEQHRV